MSTIVEETTRSDWRWLPCVLVGLVPICAHLIIVTLPWAQGTSLSTPIPPGLTHALIASAILVSSLLILQRSPIRLAVESKWIYLASVLALAILTWGTEQSFGRSLLLARGWAGVGHSHLFNFGIAICGMFGLACLSFVAVSASMSSKWTVRLAMVPGGIRFGILTIVAMGVASLLYTFAMMSLLR